MQVLPGGRLAQIVGRSSFEVNSLHGQAVNRLAPGLRVEAVAHRRRVVPVSARGRLV